MLHAWPELHKRRQKGFMLTTVCWWYGARKIIPARGALGYVGVAAKGGFCTIKTRGGCPTRLSCRSNATHSDSWPLHCRTKTLMLPVKHDPHPSQDGSRNGLIKHNNLIGDKYAHSCMETEWLSNVWITCKLYVSSQICNRGWSTVNISAQKLQAARLWRPNRSNPVTPKQEPILHVAQNKGLFQPRDPGTKSQDPTI